MSLQVDIEAAADIPMGDIEVAQTSNVSADVGGETTSPTCDGNEHASSRPSQPRFVTFFEEAMDLASHDLTRRRDGGPFRLPHNYHHFFRLFANVCTIPP